MSAYYEFKLPVKILSGDGALEHIPHELDSLGAHRPLLLSDQGLEQVGTVKIVQAALRQGGMAAAETFWTPPSRWSTRSPASTARPSATASSPWGADR